MKTYCKFCGKRIFNAAKCKALICRGCCDECNESEYFGACPNVDPDERTEDEDEE
jgi:hypothetical protein